jgi:hypothetical protein
MTACQLTPYKGRGVTPRIYFFFGGGGVTFSEKNWGKLCFLIKDNKTDNQIITKKISVANIPVAI